MAKIINSHDQLSLEQIEQFESENNVKLSELYKEFLLKWNGGKARPNIFKISDEQGSSVLNVFMELGKCMII